MLEVAQCFTLPMPTYRPIRGVTIPRLLTFSLACALCLSGSGFLHAQGSQAKTTAPDHFDLLPAGRDAYLHYAAETDRMLRQDVLDVWFPRAIDDTNGGFYADFTRDWQRSCLLYTSRCV